MGIIRVFLRDFKVFVSIESQETCQEQKSHFTPQNQLREIIMMQCKEYHNAKKLKWFFKFPISKIKYIFISF